MGMQRDRRRQAERERERDRQSQTDRDTQAESARWVIDHADLTATINRHLCEDFLIMFRKTSQG